MSRRSSFSGHGAGGPAARIRRWGFTLVELLVVIGIITLLVVLVWPLLQSSSCGSGSRVFCRNNLKQIGLALHTYRDAYGIFPPAYTVDAHGKPLHSWRTLILPYLDQNELYEKVDLTKPWDDPVNAKAAAAYVPVYICPSSRLEPIQTAYLAVVTKESCLRPAESLALSEITDGTSNTVFVVEVPFKYAVHWMEPRDAGLPLVLMPKTADDLHHAGGYFAGFADGSVQFLSSKTDPSTLRSLTTAARGDVVGQY